MIDKKIFDVASNTKKYGLLDNYSHYSSLKSSKCGDHIKIYLLIKTNKIIKFSYIGNFCIYCQASASMLGNKIMNKSVNNVKSFLVVSKDLFDKNKIFKNNKWKDFKKIMNKNNIARKECLMLPLKTLLKALNN